MDIKRTIKEHGFSQKEVAERLGVTNSSLSQTVHNDNVSLKMMRKIADIIGCQVGDFFRDEITPVKEEDEGHTFPCPHCNKPIKVGK